MLKESRPAIPAAMKRTVRQNSYFGCIHCGCPIIDYHHIEHWSDVHKHEVDNLVALCPTCHRIMHSNTYPQKQLLKDIENPYNKRTGQIHENFMLEDFDKTTLILGGNRFRNVPMILRVFDENLIYFNIAEDGEALLNATFYDKQNNLIAVIRDNEWTSYLSDELWDFEYKAGHLKIWSSQRNVLLEISAMGYNVVINAKLYCQGQLVDARKDCIQVGGMTISGCTASDQKNGICIF